MLAASLAMALLIASPATADTTVQFGSASVENEFLFFGDEDFSNAFFD